MLASHQTWLCFFNNKHFEYDRFGNLITKKRGENQSLVTYYEYDCRHRLIKVIKPSGQTITYSNEPFNLSTSKTINGKTTDLSGKVINWLPKLTMPSKVLPQFYW